MYYFASEVNFHGENVCSNFFFGLKEKPQKSVFVEVMGSIPVGDSDFFLCPTFVSC